MYVAWRSPTSPPVVAWTPSGSTSLRIPLRTRFCRSSLARRRSKGHATPEVRFPAAHWPVLSARSAAAMSTGASWRISSSRSARSPGRRSPQASSSWTRAAISPGLPQCTKAPRGGRRRAQEGCLCPTAAVRPSAPPPRRRPASPSAAGPGSSTICRNSGDAVSRVDRHPPARYCRLRTADCRHGPRRLER